MTAYKENIVLVESKTLPEWNNMNDDELMKTKSYGISLEYMTKDKILRLERAEKRLKESTYPEYNEAREWESKSYLRLQLEGEKDSNSNENALLTLKGEIKRFSTAFPNNTFFTSDKKQSEKGFLLMKELGWAWCRISFSGGHDSGGIDEIDYESETTSIQKTGHYDVESMIEKYTKNCIEGKTPTGADPFFSIENQQNQDKYIHLRKYHIKEDNPLLDGIYDKFDFNGFPSVDGYIEWDLKKEILKDDVLVPNPDYKKTPIMQFRTTEYVDYQSTIDDPDDEIRGQSYSMD